MPALHRRARLPNPDVVLSAGVLHGIERECLRVNPVGDLALTPHPGALGNKLTHPLITTDYSESQLEFTTRAYPSIEEALQELKTATVFSLSRIGDELLWPMSMPARLPAEENLIPIAYYGESVQGKSKEIYRRGLAHRYGRRMQTISGVHYNFSLGQQFWKQYHREALRHAGATSEAQALRELVDDSYFHIIRNYTRRAYLIAYLFGASPAVDASFGPRLDPRLTRLDRHTLAAPFATSLRLSDVGYSNRKTPGLHVSVNSPREYLRDLCHAITTPFPAYAAFRDRPGEMLNDHILQNENEYYAPIRPKQTPHYPERALDALTLRGVQYVEVRTLDLDPWACAGLCPERMAFLQMMLLHALFTDSPPLNDAERRQISSRLLRVCWEGRRPGLKVPTENGPVAFSEDGLQYCEELQPVADRLDRELGGALYRMALQNQTEKFRRPEQTPSGRMIAELENNPSWIHYGLERARTLRGALLAESISPAQIADLESMAQQSHRDAESLEEKARLNPSVVEAATPGACR